MDVKEFLENSELPQSWEWTTLGQIITSIQTGFPSGRHNQDGQGVPHLRPMNISPDGNIALEIVKYVEETEYHELDVGDVLFNNTNSPDWLGKTAYIAKPNNWAFSNHMTRIRVFNEIEAKYIAFWLHYLQQIGFFKMNATNHVNQASINRSFLQSNVSVPLAPYNEQIRIVEKIEQLFTILDAGVEALQRLQKNLERYKASVLKAACEGNLVPQDPDDEPASDLLERILIERRERWEADQLAKYQAKGKTPPKNWQSRYKKPVEPNTDDLPDLPEGWEYTEIESLLSLERTGMKTGPFGTLLKKHEHQPDGIPVFGIENIGEMEFKHGNKIFITEEKAEELEKYDALPGDILISRSGTVGEVCIVPEGYEQALISTNLMRVVLNMDAIDPRFFVFLFNGSPFVLSQVSELCSGSTRDFLNQKILKSIIFQIPPRDEQSKIIAKVDELYTLIEKLEEFLGGSIKRSERLRQAILKKAFSGELVPQDPHDEPASELLKRIEGERGK